MIKVIKHDDWLRQQLADAEFAAEYLNAASEDEDPASYLTALRMVVEGREGFFRVRLSQEWARQHPGRLRRAVQEGSPGDLGFF